MFRFVVCALVAVFTLPPRIAAAEPNALNLAYDLATAQRGFDGVAEVRAGADLDTTKQLSRYGQNSRLYGSQIN
jgi:hypothetical protein